MEVYLGARSHLFDRHYPARPIGPLVIARARDAADVAFTTRFDPTCCGASK